MISDFLSTLTATSVALVIQAPRADQLQALLAADIAALPQGTTWEGLDLSGGGDGETFTILFLVDTGGGGGPDVGDVGFEFGEAYDPNGRNLEMTRIIAALIAAGRENAFEMGVAQGGSAGKTVFFMAGVAGG